MKSAKKGKKVPNSAVNGKVGFAPIVGAMRYVIKAGGKTKRLDVIKARIPTDN